MLGALVFLAAFALYLGHLCPTVSSGDSAELVLAGLGLDVTHPPGYPLLALAIRLAGEIPAGGVMLRAGLIPASAGAAAVALLFSTARLLGARWGPALAGAALFATGPFLWWQSTMLEKYSLQLCLAALALRVSLSPRSSFLSTAFAVTIAVAHHPLSLFLAPLVLLKSPGLGRNWPRMILIATVIAVLPVSLRPVYSAIRSDSLRRLKPVSGENWGEPCRARAMFEYLTLRFYGKRLAGEGAGEVTLLDHFRFHPRQLTWPGLLAGIWGLLLLAGRNRPAAQALAAAIVLSFLFSVRMSLPPSLSEQNHQNSFLILALAATLSAEAARERLARWRGARVLAGGAVAAALLLLARGRAPGCDASRHFFVHDYAASVLKLCPRGAVVMGAFDYDLFSPWYFQKVLGVRRDLKVLPAPRRAASGRFVVRRRYRPLAAAVLPRAALRFRESTDANEILRRLVQDNGAAYCFVVSGLSEPVVPRDLFLPRATVFLAKGGRCFPRRPDPAKGWRALSSRTWFSPGAAHPAHRVVLDYLAEALWRTAGQATEDGTRTALLELRARLIPDRPAAWIALGQHHAQRDREVHALHYFRRAIAVSPVAPDARFALLDFLTASGRHLEAALHLREMLATPPFSGNASSGEALRQLDRGNAGGGQRIAWRILAETALAEAEALPPRPESDPRLLHLLSFAAEIAPDWLPAQTACAQAMLARDRAAEAEPSVRRLARLDPANPEPQIRLAAQFLKNGDAAGSARLLREAVRRAPAAAPAWFYLGQAELASGRKRAAADAFGKFLELEPDSPHAARLREVIGRKAR